MKTLVCIVYLWRTPNFNYTTFKLFLPTTPLVIIYLSFAPLLHNSNDNQLMTK